MADPPVTPKTPTARKAPMNSSPSSPAQQQRKSSVSQPPPKKPRQPRKRSRAKAAPKPAVQQNLENLGTEDAEMLANKGKVKIEPFSPKKVLNRCEDMEESGPDIHMSSTVPLLKKQKVGQKTKNPAQNPTPSPNTSKPPSQLLSYILHTQPSLLPASAPITSAHLDTIAHAMWQVAFSAKNGYMLQQACQYSAIFSPLKLAALAKLNFLPSWWYLRECAVAELHELVGREEGEEDKVDDGVMEDVWKRTVRWCVEANKFRIRNGGWGQNAMEMVRRELGEE
ncbi:hypothetical protein BDW02DRAFT_182522 [Decorospora gaudefroyi]|uniref:Uncharacterized protein n=1 Tax=Decorospora gaudefroyi TaxID=184978 RepID=A0A6A5K3F5_9PLEO|nr:hypothetical protein BDW02DRAFT_182522 [Decorospora gaudefroyi]